MYRNTQKQREERKREECIERHTQREERNREGCIERHTQRERKGRGMYRDTLEVIERGRSQEEARDEQTHKRGGDRNV